MEHGFTPYEVLKVSVSSDEIRICFIFDFQPQKAKVLPTPVDFTITPDTLQNGREVTDTFHVITSGFGFITDRLSR